MNNPSPRVRDQSVNDSGLTKKIVFGSTIYVPNNTKDKKRKRKSDGLDLSSSRLNDSRMSVREQRLKDYMRMKGMKNTGDKDPINLPPDGTPTISMIS